MSTPGARILNRVLLVAILGLIAFLVLSIPTRSPSGETAQAPASPTPIAAPAQGAPPPQVAHFNGVLQIPVAGVAPSLLSDNFADARGTDRRHGAIDIMAPRGTRILAAAEGRVEKLHFSEGGGGITVYVRSPDRRWTYYYAHLDRYAPGLAEGQQVRRGALLGFVGSTGSASPDGPHLHFAINATAPDQRWWEGTPVNPYPLLVGAGTR